MADAVTEYARHRAAPDSWALGRFVVPLSRRNELRICRRDTDRDGGPWPVSLLAAPTDVARIRDVRAGDPELMVESVEWKAPSVKEASSAAALTALGIEVFVEPARLADFDAMAVELARIGAAAKIRTGGVTRDAFPSPRQVLAFLRSCIRAGLRFKATAGLHHAVRGEYRLTYEPVPPTGEMFGFLNIAMAAALLWSGRSEDAVLRALEEHSADAFEFSEGGVDWRGEQLTRRELDEFRARFFTGFGSCSFSEPMAEVGLEPLPRA
jgi:hypothetical protein